MPKFTVHLKSGAILTVLADNFIITWEDNRVTKWRAEGLKQGIRKPLFIKPSTIIAVEEAP